MHQPIHVMKTKLIDQSDGWKLTHRPNLVYRDADAPICTNEV